eukprot:UN10356
MEDVYPWGCLAAIFSNAYYYYYFICMYFCCFIIIIIAVGFMCSLSNGMIFLCKLVLILKFIYMNI